MICPAVQDYFNLINSKGGIEGYKIRVTKSTTTTRCRRRSRPMSARSSRAVSHDASTARRRRRRSTSGWSRTRFPAPRLASAPPPRRTARFPYLFPVAATYWSQAAAAVQFVKDKLGGSLKGKKIAYVYYDNPAGKEPMPILEGAAEERGL